MVSPVLIASSEAGRSAIGGILTALEREPWPADYAAARDHYDGFGPPLPGDIKGETVDAGGASALLLHPIGAARDRIVFYLHGGGYVFGSPKSHGAMAGEIARAAGCDALVLDYRRAPEHPFPAAVEDAVAAYIWLLDQGYDSRKIAIAGDSAGGGLAMSVLGALKAQGRPVPSAGVTISPWVDMEATGESYKSRGDLDPYMLKSVVDQVTELYMAGQDLRHPAASPIHADMSGFPPMLIQVGQREILFSDAAMLAVKATAAGVDVIFEEWEGMIHVWHHHYLVLPEGRAAIERIGAFLHSHLFKETT